MTEAIVSAPHTPGPWNYKVTTIGHPDNAINPCVSSETGRFVARVAWRGSTVPGMTSLSPDTFDEAQANATLIAAAPDLLAALKGFVGQPHDLNCVEGQFAAALIAARDAIAKAEGR